MANEDAVVSVVARAVIVIASSLAAGLGLCFAFGSVAQVSGADPDIPIGLEWQDLGGYAKSVETRFGTVSVTGLGPDDERATVVEIRLNGEVAVPPFPRHGDYFLVSIRAVFELADRDIVLLTGTAGGSTSPYVLLAAEIDARGMRLVTDPAFRSSDWTHRVATDGQRLYFDLGYELRRRKTALLDGSGLHVYLTDSAPAPVPDATCRFLHSVVGSPACTSRQGLPNSVLTPLNALDHRPGFEREPFLQACELAGRLGEVPSYDAFEHDVCGIP